MHVTTVLYNANIYTMDSINPRAEAIAIAGDRVVATGSNAAMRALLSTDGRAVDLHGQTVLPGLIDAHLHFLCMASA